MALSYSTTIDKGVRQDRFAGGMRIAVVDVTVATSTDYSSGLALTASKFGMNYILDVPKATLRASSSTHSGEVTAFWDSNTDKLRIYRLAGSDATALTEVAGSNLAANDVVRCTVLGY